MSRYITHFKSSNYNERAAGTKIEFLIIHYTGCDFTTSLHALTDQASDHPVSAHYLIDQEGDVYALVDEKFRAWHAGVSRWHNLEDINSRSIGIELVHPEYGPSYENFSNQQMESLIILSHEILARHSMPPHQILGHSDIAPMRKVDPGPLFDWPRMAREGIGFYPDFKQITPEVAKDSELSDQNLVLEIQKHLIAYGYALESTGDLNIETETVIRAFQMHFWPQCLSGMPTLELKQRLMILNSQTN